MAEWTDGETLTLAERANLPGAIWRTSWGYDQTNAEYWQVVRATKASLVLRRIAAEVRDGRLYPIGGQWAVDTLLGMGTDGRDRERGYSEKLCRKPRVDSNGYQHTSVRIDDVRLAWPYEGGGAYDTYAAGMPGH